MMKSLLIITLGTRDVVFSDMLATDKRLYEHSELKSFLRRSGHRQVFEMRSTRNTSELLLDIRENQPPEVFEGISEHVQMPMIIPAVEYVLGRHDKIHQLFLVTTDQKDEGFRERDTSPLFHLIKGWLSKKYGERILVFKEQKAKADLIYHDVQYREMGKFTNNLAKTADPSRHIVYLLPQGGIDAINTSLLLRSIEGFPHFKQLTVTEGSTKPYSLKFPDYFRQNLNENKIQHELSRRNYPAINEGLTSNKLILGLARYNDYRLNLDYKAAIGEIDQLLEDPEHRNIYKDEFNDLLRFLDPARRSENMLEDLFVSARIKLDQANYFTFVLMCFAIAENFLVPLIERHFNIEIKFDLKNEHMAWREFISREESLKDYLSEVKLPGNRDLSFDYPNRTAYFHIVKYILDSQDKDVADVESVFRQLESIAFLRNEVAHEMSSINRELIADKLGSVNKSQEPVKAFLEDLAAFLGIGHARPYGFTHIVDNLIKRELR